MVVDRLSSSWEQSGLIVLSALFMFAVVIAVIQARPRRVFVDRLRSRARAWRKEIAGHRVRRSWSGNVRRCARHRDGSVGVVARFEDPACGYDPRMDSYETPSDSVDAANLPEPLIGRELMYGHEDTAGYVFDRVARDEQIVREDESRTEQPDATRRGRYATKPSHGLRA